MNAKRGFTLIEMIMSIVIIALLAALSAPLLQGLSDLFSFQTNRGVLEETGLYAQARMTREMRRMRNDTSLLAATRNNFEFIDRDNVRIRYYLSGNTVRRTQNGNDRIFLDNVQADGLVFTYYADAEAATAENGDTSAVIPVSGAGVKTNLRYVKILIRMQNRGQTYEIRDAVRLRNVEPRESQIFP
jgi:prepilin-type N-terminal cleavage/methylation domain-containing protein